MIKENYSSPLTHRITERLKATGQTQNGAAITAGLDRTTVRDILAGKSKNPRRDTLEKLADVFQCSVEWLVTGRENNTSHMQPMPDPSQDWRNTKDSWKRAGELIVDAMNKAELPITHGNLFQLIEMLLEACEAPCDLQDDKGKTIARTIVVTNRLMILAE